LKFEFYLDLGASEERGMERNQSPRLEKDLGEFHHNSHQTNHF
jgi:hypothetical protein